MVNECKSSASWLLGKSGKKANTKKFGGKRRRTTPSSFLSISLNRHVGFLLVTLLPFFGRFLPPLRVTRHIAHYSGCSLMFSAAARWEFNSPTAFGHGICVQHRRLQCPSYYIPLTPTLTLAYVRLHALRRCQLAFPDF